MQLRQAPPRKRQPRIGRLSRASISCQAFGAVRARPDDALLPGNPVDADVQEAADDRADDEQAYAVDHVDLPEIIHRIRPRRVPRPGFEDGVGHLLGVPADGRDLGVGGLPIERRPGFEYLGDLGQGARGGQRPGGR